MTSFDSYFFAALASALAPNLRVVGAQACPQLPRNDAAGGIRKGVILTEKGIRYNVSVANTKSAQNILELRAHIGRLWKYYKEHLRRCDFQVDQTVFYGTVPTDISVAFSNAYLEETPLSEEVTYNFSAQPGVQNAFYHDGSALASSDEYGDISHSSYRSSIENAQDSDFDSSSFSTMLLTSERGFSASPSPKIPD